LKKVRKKTQPKKGEDPQNDEQKAFPEKGKRNPSTERSIKEN